MIRLVIDVETSDIIGIKELLAMALERLGRANVVSCELLDTQIEMGYRNG